MRTVWSGSLVALAVLVLVGGCTPGEKGPAWYETGYFPIIGGAADSGHPAVGAVMSSNALCSGTLITPKIVLTAAHCMAGGMGTPKSFVTGSSINSWGGYTQYDISKCVAHSQFGTSYVDGYQVQVHDIGICVLAESAAEVPMKYRTASLSGMQGTQVTFVGFGQSSVYDAGETGDKMKVTVTIGEVNSYGFWNFTSASNPKNTCGGDSGGPGFVKNNGVEEVAGVVSSGDAQCVQTGFNTRVDIHASWIQDKIAQYDPGSVTPAVCGNGACETGETKTSCPEDCGSAGTCGDGTCGAGESYQSCASDCQQADCGQIGYAGCCAGDLLKYCEQGTLQMINCANNKSCGWRDAGYYDCGTAGGIDPSGENLMDCPGTAGPVCGNGKCEAGEDATSCAADCPAAECGDGKCEAGEDNASCPADCQAAAAECGNGTCETGEDKETCPEDCDQDVPVGCGDGSCAVGEYCDTCPEDCGQCIGGTGSCAAGPVRPIPPWGGLLLLVAAVLSGVIARGARGLVRPR
jgi:secreted trypsin-like serine protease